MRSRVGHDDEMRAAVLFLVGVVIIRGTLRPTEAGENTVRYILLSRPLGGQDKYSTILRIPYLSHNPCSVSILCASQHYAGKAVQKARHQYMRLCSNGTAKTYKLRHVAHVAGGRYGTIMIIPPFYSSTGVILLIKIIKIADNGLASDNTTYNFAKCPLLPAKMCE
ncbi:hypothetical protein Trydic_g39 [Trypoxylus dichotomus]